MMEAGISYEITNVENNLPSCFISKLPP